MQRIIDTHIHITPGVDDGSTDLRMSLEMLEILGKQNCMEVFATPHSFAFEGGNEEYVWGQIRLLQDTVKEMGLPVKIYPGCEIKVSPHRMDRVVEMLRTGALPSMNHTRYVLAEFSTHRGDFEDAGYCLSRLMEAGWIPIIAHAERYSRTFTTVENIWKLKEAGCLVQINCYDLTEAREREIRTCCQDLLAAELVDFVGSDGHRIGHRPPALENGAAFIRRNCRSKYARMILYENAARWLVVGQS